MVEREGAAIVDRTTISIPALERRPSQESVKLYDAHHADPIMHERRARRPAAGAASGSNWLSTKRADMHACIPSMLLNSPNRILRARMPDGDAKTEATNMDAVKARDWNRMWEMTQSLQAAAKQSREEHNSKPIPTISNSFLWFRRFRRSRCFRRCQ